MENNKKTITSIVALSAIIATFGVTAFTSAHFGGFDLNQEDRDKMKQAVVDGDYSTWKDINDTKTKITDIITEDNFLEFGKMQSLMQGGKFDEANVLREDLGLPENSRERVSHNGMMGGHGMMGEDHEAIKTAVENSDYDTWKNLVGDTMMSEVVKNEEDFKKMVEMHELMEDGNTDKASAMHDEIGFPEDGDNDYGMHRGMMGGKWSGRINQEIK